MDLAEQREDGVGWRREVQRYRDDCYRVWFVEGMQVVVDGLWKWGSCWEVVG